MDLHAVKTRFAGQLHSRSEVLDDLQDLVAAKAPHEGRGIEVESARSAHRRASAGGAVRHVAAVAELDRSLRPMGVHPVGQAAQPRNDLGTHPQLAIEGQARLAHGRIGHGRHADPAPGHGDVVIIQVLGRAVPVGHVLKGGGTDDPVPQGNRPDPAGRKDNGFHQKIKGMMRFSRRSSNSSANSDLLSIFLPMRLKYI